MAKKPSILTLHQKAVLDLISLEKYFTKNYYLAGGTALAEFYLQHRMSEDLDFFIEQREVNPFPIVTFLKKNIKVLNLNKWETKRVLGLHSFFLHFKDKTILKVDFNYYPFPRIDRGMKYNSLEIESIHDIGVDKVHTIVLKPRARDYIDVYFILKEKDYNFQELIMQAKAKFDWDISALELGARFLDAQELSDFPRMLKPIDHQEWRDFFINEARKLKKEIVA